MSPSQTQNVPAVFTSISKLTSVIFIYTYGINMNSDMTPKGRYKVIALSKYTKN